MTAFCRPTEPIDGNLDPNIPDDFGIESDLALRDDLVFWRDPPLTLLDVSVCRGFDGPLPLRVAFLTYILALLVDGDSDTGASPAPELCLLLPPPPENKLVAKGIKPIAATALHIIFFFLMLILSLEERYDTLFSNESVDLGQVRLGFAWQLARKHRS